MNAHSPWLLSGRKHEEYRTSWGCTRLPSLYTLVSPLEMVFILFRPPGDIEPKNETLSPLWESGKG